MKKEKAQGPTTAKEIIEIEGIIEIGNLIIRINFLKIIQQTILLYPSDKNVSEKPLKEPAPIEVKAEEKPVLAEKPIPTKPKRKKTEKLPKVDLNSVGLKLVETSSKPISEPKKESTKKAPPKKVADWQKQKTDKKDTKELVMVETKTTKATKPKKTTKPKAAPKTKKAKVTSKKD